MVMKTKALRPAVIALLWVYSLNVIVSIVHSEYNQSSNK